MLMPMSMLLSMPSGLLLVLFVLGGVLGLLALMLAAMDLERDGPSYRDLWLDD
jgi:hypothetical protein